MDQRSTDLTILLFVTDHRSRLPEAIALGDKLPNAIALGTTPETTRRRSQSGSAGVFGWRRPLK